MYEQNLTKVVGLVLRKLTTHKSSLYATYLEVGFDAGVAWVVPVETSVGLVAPDTGDVPDDLEAGVGIPGFVGLVVAGFVFLLWKQFQDQVGKYYYIS